MSGPLIRAPPLYYAAKEVFAVEEQLKENTPTLEENLKKAVTELLVLSLLYQEDLYAAQITKLLEARSHGILHIVFPYSVLYRLIRGGYVLEAYKKNAPDGRRRQYYQITDAGRVYCRELRSIYRRVIGGVGYLLEETEPHDL